MLSLLFWRLKCAGVKECSVIFSYTEPFQMDNTESELQINGVAFYPNASETFFRLYRMFSVSSITATCAIIVFESLQK